MDVKGDEYSVSSEDDEGGDNSAPVDASSVIDYECGNGHTECAILLAGGAIVELCLRISSCAAAA